MKTQIFIGFLVIFTVNHFISGKNWCDKENKCDSRPHIACVCDWDYTICESREAIDLSKSQKDLILNLHNELRNNFSSGTTLGFLKRPGRMMIVEWDDDLEKFATCNAKQCDMQYDYCHRTEKYPFPGQNIFIAKSFADNIYVTQVIREAIEVWWNQSQYVTTQADLDSYVGWKDVTITNRVVFSHFAQMIHDKTRRIGCGVTKFFSNGRYCILVVCNYGTMNWLNNTVYSVADNAGDNCTERDNNLNSLCKDSDQDKEFEDNTKALNEWWTARMKA